MKNKTDNAWTKREGLVVTVRHHRCSDNRPAIVDEIIGEYVYKYRGERFCLLACSSDEKPTTYIHTYTYMYVHEGALIVT